MTISSEKNKAISGDLVNWYRANQRHLPWRNMNNPYYTWISEVMLQQTQVDTVIPYYERFKARFPTMQSLANADEEDVLKHWEGLGYYSRARNLQAGVREVVNDYGGVVPKDRSTLLKIKGIGPYTSGAILSIAYHMPEPAVDGNVMRVLSRLFEIEDDIAKPKTRQVFEAILYELIPADAASDFNQGLMELGALVCKPKQPRCDTCPVFDHCLAAQSERQEAFPVKSKKIKQRLEAYEVLWIQDDEERVLIHKRDEKGLLANLWEFPMVLKDSSESKLIDIQDFFNQTLGLNAEVLPIKHNKTLSHTFSHLKWELNLWQIRVTITEQALPSSYKWVTLDQLHTFPFSVAHQKVRDLFQNE